jgi:hypothetical protein
MNKRLQVILSDDAWNAVDTLTKEANTNFENGYVNFSDTISEMILCSKVDVRNLQMKHVNLRKSLRALASKSDLDIESALKALMEIKSKTGKKVGKAQPPEEALA